MSFSIERKYLLKKIDVKINKTYDVAVLNLPEHADISSFKSSIKLSSYDKIKSTFFDVVAEELSVKMDVECRMAGYGIDNEGKAGTIHTGVVGKIQGYYDQSLNLIKAVYHKTNGTVKNEALVNPGDSGGPLYCKKSEDTNWTLVGITPGYSPLLTKTQVQPHLPQGFTLISVISDEDFSVWTPVWSISDFLPIP